MTLFGAADRLFELDGPTKANLVLGCEIPARDPGGIEVSAKIEHLFGERPYEEGFIGPGRSAVAGVGLRY